MKKRKCLHLRRAVIALETQHLRHKGFVIYNCGQNELEISVKLNENQ